MDWIKTTYYILDTLLCTKTEELVKSTNIMINNIKSINYTPILTKIFMVYVNIQVKATKIYNHLYNNYDFVKTTVDNVSYSIEYVKTKYNKVRIEPFEKQWVCISMLLDNNKDMFFGNKDIYLEKYQYIKPHKTPDVSETDYYNECLTYFSKTAMSIANCDNNVIEIMITMKVNNNLFNKSFRKNTTINENEKLYNNKISKASFLSIEYTHPEMKNKISIEIPKNMYFINNNILSSLFIKRYLEYQYEPYIFDDNYVIDLMDNDVNTFSINHTEYIILSENTYQVIKNE